MLETGEVKFRKDYELSDAYHNLEDATKQINKIKAL
jgi:hypothetical protein